MGLLRWLFGLDAKSKARRRWAALQAHRTVETRTGLKVRSKAERRIADVLDALGFEYEYERYMCGAAPDFYVPRFDLIIEFWGTQGPDDPERKGKIARYLAAKHNLIGIEREDWHDVESVLLRRLYKYDQSVYRRYERATGRRL